MNISEKIQKLKKECLELYKLKDDLPRYYAEAEKVAEEVSNLGLDEVMEYGELRFILRVILGNKIASLPCEEFTREIENRLRIIETDFYFQLIELENFPNNYQLGRGELLSFNSLPTEVKSSAEDLAKGEIAKLTSRQEVLKEFVKRIVIQQEPSKGYWLKIRTSAISSNIRFHNAFDSAEESLDILRIIKPSSSVLLPQYAISLNAGEDKAFVAASVPMSRYPYDASLDRSVAKLSKVCLNPSCELEERIKNAIHFFRIAENHSLLHQRIFYYAAAIENLVLGRADRDVLRWKFSEKGAILSADNLDERLRAADELRDIYDKRSSIAHGEKSEYDFFLTVAARHYLHNIMWQIMDLVDSEGLRTVSPKNDKKKGKSLDEYLEKIIYSG